MEWRPPLQLCVVAIEKGAFGVPLTSIANFTYFTIELEEFFLLLFVEDVEINKNCEKWR